ncbi:MAG: copper homeostasis protein CutC, partial [Vibrio sp.]
FDPSDIELMIEDIEQAKRAQLDGVVIGVLTAQGDIDMPACQRLIQAAGSLGVTFHRAFDQCRHPEKALEDVINLGCERILTSGLAATAEQGIEQLRALHQQAKGRIEIMAGAGVHAGNVKQIIAQTQIKEVHLSGKSTRPSLMQVKTDSAKMGAADIDDFQIPVTSPELISQVVKVLNPSIN